MTGVVDSTNIDSAPGMLFPGLHLEPLRRQDYEVIGMAHGHGCAHYVALWPLPIFWVDLEGGRMSWFTFDSGGVAERAAWYGAIDSQPHADVMLSPRVYTKEKGFAFWYRRDCVALDSKAIEIKLDRQTAK